MYFAQAQLLLVSSFGTLTLQLQPHVAAHDDGEEVSESHGEVRRFSRAHAPVNAGDESGKARREAGADFPASAEIRKRNEPDRRQPASTYFPDSQGAGVLL